MNFIFKALIGAGLIAELATPKLMAAPVTSPRNQKNYVVAPEGYENKFLGVRLDDLVNLAPSFIPQLANLNSFLNKNLERIIGRDIDVIHNIFLESRPYFEGNDVVLSVVAFVRYENDQFSFEKFKIQYEKNDKKLSTLSISLVSSLGLDQAEFDVQGALADRKVIISEHKMNFKMVFPIGVGAFDNGVINEGRVSLITPRLKSGYIFKSTVISKREKPRYYRGKPFIRLSKGENLPEDATPIAFHIEINDKFNRGFDSHGCMRLREQDLMAFHDLILFGSDEKLPVTLNYHTADKMDHPAPFNNKVYKSVLNKWSAESPYFIYDRDNLVQLIYKYEDVSNLVAKLVDTDLDNYYDSFDYDTARQMQEQEVRRVSYCKEQVELGNIKERKLDDCINEYKRDSSIKDFFYRKWMGIKSVEDGNNKNMDWN